METVALPKELVERLVIYLQTKPYAEVGQAVPLLIQALQQHGEDSCQVAENEDILSAA